MQTHPIKYPTDLTDEEWRQIQSLVPKPRSGKGKRGRPALERRLLVNAIFYVVRSGCAWRLLPKGDRTDRHHQRCQAVTNPMNQIISTDLPLNLGQTKLILAVPL